VLMGRKARSNPRRMVIPTIGFFKKKWKF